MKCLLRICQRWNLESEQYPFSLKQTKYNVFKKKKQNMLLMFDEVKTSAVIKYNNNNVATDPASVNIKIIGKFEELLKKHCVSFVQ